MLLNQKKRKLQAFGIIAFILVPLLGWVFPSKAKPNPPVNRPNIIYILTDDMGYSDVSSFGGNFVPTPNIDRIAANGRKFTHFYSAAPICSPSRAGFITGNYPARWNFSTY